MDHGGMPGTPGVGSEQLSALGGGTALPENHEDQILLGIRIIQHSFTSKEQRLNTELQHLRMSCEEQKGQANTLQRKNSALEVEIMEGNQRAQQLSEENRELFKTVQALRRQLQRLEGLKRKVLNSMKDDESADYTTEGEEARLAMRDDYLRTSLPLTTGSVYAGSMMNALPPMSETPSAPATATQHHRIDSPGIPAPPAYGGAGGMAQASTNGFDGSSPDRSVAQAPNSGGGTGIVDGKQFFRQARSQLSYEAFNEFLASIKRLNNQQSTREDTLGEARRIFGPELQQLYMEFEQLLSRHEV